MFTCESCNKEYRGKGYKSKINGMRICNPCLHETHEKITTEYLEMRSQGQREYEALNKIADKYPYILDSIKAIIGANKKNVMNLF